MEDAIRLAGSAGIALMIWGVVRAVRRNRRGEKAFDRWLAVFLGAGFGIVLLFPLPEGDPAGAPVAEQQRPSSNAPQPAARPAVPPEQQEQRGPVDPPGMQQPPAEVPAGTQRAVVVQVDSGDSVQLTAIEPGDALPELTRIDARLLDIRAPRPGECLFDEATDRLRQLAPVGTSVRVQREPGDDRGGPRLHVWTEAGRFTNAEMVRSGLAEVQLDSPGSPHRSEISLAADRAGDARADLQGRCGRTEVPGTTTSAQPSPQPQPQPEPKPRPRPQPNPQPGQDEDEDGGAAHYSNCSAAKAAGAAPLHRGDPGYRSELDRDGDGVACET